MAEHNTATAASQKLGLVALLTIVVSSMIGGGVDSLPKTMSLHAAVGPVFIAWLIAGFGMYFIASTFRILSDIRQDLNAGIYMYAREGFGAFIGFLVAWGYWLMTLFGNVAFAVMVMDALNYFSPGTFSGGNNVVSIVCASCLIWGFNFLVLSGAKTSGMVNIIGTVAKLIPLTVFVLILAYFMDFLQFTSNVWGHSAANPQDNLGSILSQILSPMDVALWSFIGIEGAVALSGRAKNKNDVGKATLIGFVISTVICILISILPFGLMPQSILKTIPTPSTAGVLGMVAGHWGEWFMNIGVLISVLTGWVAWTMICAEIPMIAAKNGTFPKVFAHKNSKDADSVSLWISSLIMQLVLFLVYFSNHAWLTMLEITAVTVLPAYFASTAFLFKLCINNDYQKYAKTGKTRAVISAFIGMIFCLFMVFAGGLKNVLMVPLILTAGIPLFIWAHKEQRNNTALFTAREKIYLIVLLIIDFLSIIAFLALAV